MKRVSWRLVLIGGVVIIGLLAYLYYQRWSQALDHYSRGFDAYQAHDWHTADAEYSEAIRVAPPFYAQEEMRTPRAEMPAYI